MHNNEHQSIKEKQWRKQTSNGKNGTGDRIGSLELPATPQLNGEVNVDEHHDVKLVNHVLALPFTIPTFLILFTLGLSHSKLLMLIETPTKHKLSWWRQRHLTLGHSFYYLRSFARFPSAMPSDRFLSPSNSLPWNRIQGHFHSIRQLQQPRPQNRSPVRHHLPLWWFRSRQGYYHKLLQDPLMSEEKGEIKREDEGVVGEGVIVDLGVGRWRGFRGWEVEGSGVNFFF